jgi:hypothetical protein
MNGPRQPRSWPPNPRVQRTRVARCARPGSPLTRHPLGACLTLDGPRRAGLSSRPRLRPVAWSAWCVAEGSGWESSATSEELRAPRACAMRADERGGRGRAAGWLVLALGNSTLNVSARPPAQSAPTGARAARARALRIARQPAHPAVTAWSDSEAWWRVNPTVAERLTRA